MAAFNIVRFRVKPGLEQQLIAKHLALRPAFPGYLGGNLVKTGERTFCILGEWRSFKHLADARPQMIAVLDQLRDMLEDLGGGLGVTDPASGEVVAKMPATKAPKKRASKARKAKKAAKRPAKKKSAKKR